MQFPHYFWHKKHQCAKIADLYFVIVSILPFVRPPDILEIDENLYYCHLVANCTIPMASQGVSCLNIKQWVSCLERSHNKVEHILMSLSHYDLRLSQ